MLKNKIVLLFGAVSFSYIVTTGVVVNASDSNNINNNLNQEESLNEVGTPRTQAVTFDETNNDNSEIHTPIRRTHSTHSRIPSTTSGELSIDIPPTNPNRTPIQRISSSPKPLDVRTITNKEKQIKKIEKDLEPLRKKINQLLIDLSKEKKESKKQVLNSRIDALRGRIRDLEIRRSELLSQISGSSSSDRLPLSPGNSCSFIYFPSVGWE